MFEFSSNPPVVICIKKEKTLYYLGVYYESRKDFLFSLFNVFRYFRNIDRTTKPVNFEEASLAIHHLGLPIWIYIVCIPIKFLECGLEYELSNFTLKISCINKLFYRWWVSLFYIFLTK